MNLEEQIYRLHHQQLRTWDEVALRYKALEQIEQKEMLFSCYRMTATFNPDRIRSTAAPVDRHSIQTRTCFLCSSNRPKEQMKISWNGQYDILVNPFPIFPHHFTIPAIDHTPQVLSGKRMAEMLEFARALPAFTIFYNGPQCGASAPDHFHFQAGDRNCMPVETEIRQQAETLCQSGQLLLQTCHNDIRKMLILKSPDPVILLRTLEKIKTTLNLFMPAKPEPMLNVLVFYENSEWCVCIFPRKKHRPRQFFAEGDEKITFSPGSVDFGGLLIFPEKKDFNKITPVLLEDLFSQLTWDETVFNTLVLQLQKQLI